MIELLALVLRITLYGLLVLTALLSVGVWYESRAKRRAQEQMRPPGWLVDLEDGRRLHVLCKGDAPGPTVVIEMGAAEPAPFFWDIQDAVAQFARVIVYDRTGFGWSSGAIAPVTIEQRAADLGAMLRAANVPGPYVLVGHSYGGILIRLLARDFPELAVGFVFVDAPDENVVLRDSYQKFLREKMLPQIKMASALSRFGILRCLAAVSPKFDLIPSAMGSEARRAMDAAGVHDMFGTGRLEFESILNASVRLRTEGFGGVLGDRPVIVLTHGIKFPPPYDVIELGWDEGQAHLAALSTNSQLILAEHSQHMLQFDDAPLVIDSIRRVFEAARDGRVLGQHNARQEPPRKTAND